jgi:hypothetical protein
VSGLRIAFDVDGVLADFAATYHDIEVRLFGPESIDGLSYRHDEPASVAAADLSMPRDVSTQRDVKRRQRSRAAVWQVITTTRDFWAGVQPIDPDAVRRLHRLSIENHWEVFFITRRPPTRGDTVQRQTQRWLCDQGFEMPSVIVLNGSRHAFAATLCLDYYVDDNTTNCVDVTAGSPARSILIVDHGNSTVLANARRLGIATARNIVAALDILEDTTAARPGQHMLNQIARLVGWT